VCYTYSPSSHSQPLRFISLFSSSSRVQNIFSVLCYVHWVCLFGAVWWCYIVFSSTLLHMLDMLPWYIRIMLLCWFFFYVAARGISYRPTGNLQYCFNASVCGWSCNEKYCFRSTGILAVEAKSLRSLGYCPWSGMDFHQHHSQSKWNEVCVSSQLGRVGNIGSSYELDKCYSISV
jgi:hypothetical protein